MSGHVQEDYPLVGGYGENRSKWFYVGAIVFVCWNILLFSLAVAAIAKVNNISDPKQPEPVIFSQSVSATANNTVPVMNVVSLLPNGSVRSGAGTTVFFKTNPPPPFGVGSKNVRVARFIEDTSEDHVIVAWTNNTASYAVLATLSLDKQSVTGWYKPVKMPFAEFYDLITLANNHFIIAADKAVWAGTANTNPGAMTISDLGSINYSEANAIIWNDVRLTALGLSNFLMTYNTPFINVDEGTTFGAVVGSVVWDMVNKVPNVTFASTVQTWAGSFPVHDAFALSDNTFVVAFATNSTSRQLACMFGSFSAADKNITFTDPTVFESISPQYHLSAVGIDGNTGMVVLVDGNKDFALRAVLVHRSDFKINGVHFGDVLTIEDGVADNIYTNSFKNGVVPFIDSAKVSFNKAVIAWSDYSNSGRLTTAIVTVDQAANLHSSPLYVIGQALALKQLNDYHVSVAGLSIDAFGQYGAVVIDRNNAVDAASAGHVALVEVGPKAYGVAAHTAFAGQSSKVVVSGLLDLPSSFPTDLKPGHLYFGRTDGSLEAGPLAGSIDKAIHYITLDDGSLVTVDSAVGVAVGKRQLYVLPSFIH